ncbi:hypothetical protein PL78_15060 [Yersinia entomophaga]|uniref:Uncharacterized protein n=1 Tax=Yersinia entomophaga TaxID=935293 RepID=A0ABM6BNA9_YERET|nr:MULTISPECIES: hypothetical protein [Yersinia]ANI31133.1 hypothetical protein PL78_15060 [Yersinia entomophaga]OWF86335.1 hypothetical protein B4914_15095 [Yersinia entomophaga]
MNNVNISQFTITLPGSNQFYANGRQQMPVLITIQKQEFSGSGWNNVDLNDEEKRSVTVREINRDNLPVGWDVDQAPNGYSQGIRGLSYEEMDREIDNNTERSGPEPFAGATRIFRYLRSNQRVETRIFMAAVTIQFRDANNQLQRRVITTSFNADGMVFSSSISLLPVPPLRILASALNRDVDIGHSRSDSKGHWAQVDVYYWTLPSGVRVHSDTAFNSGNTTLRNNLRIFFDSGRYTSGWMARNRTSLRVNEIRSDNSSALVNLRHGHGDIRAINYYNNRNNQNIIINGQVSVDIIDNFGNLHQFSLRTINNQDVVISNR